MSDGKRKKRPPVTDDVMEQVRIAAQQWFRKRPGWHRHKRKHDGTSEYWSFGECDAACKRGDIEGKVWATVEVPDAEVTLWLSEDWAQVHPYSLDAVAPLFETVGSP